MPRISPCNAPTCVIAERMTPWILVALSAKMTGRFQSTSKKKYTHLSKVCPLQGKTHALKEIHFVINLEKNS